MLAPHILDAIVEQVSTLVLLMVNARLHLLYMELMYELVISGSIMLGKQLGHSKHVIISTKVI